MVYKVEQTKNIRKNMEQKFITYFATKEEALRFIENTTNRGTIVERREKDKDNIEFVYFDLEEQTQSKIRLAIARNTAIPKLKENQVWMKLYSSIDCLREVMIMTFKTKENYDDYLKKLNLYDKHIYRDRKVDGLRYFLKSNDFTEEILYALKA